MKQRQGQNNKTGYKEPNYKKKGHEKKKRKHTHKVLADAGQGRLYLMHADNQRITRGKIIPSTGGKRRT